MKHALIGLAVLAATVLSTETAGAQGTAQDTLTLRKYPANQIYSGPIRTPDFRGRDRAFAYIRTRLTQGMKSGVNYAGRYALIEIGCGSGCRTVYVGDLATGKISEFPLGGDDNPSLQVKFARNSRGVIAYWVAQDRCLREVFSWDGSTFESHGAAEIGASDICYSLPQ